MNNILSRVVPALALCLPLLTFGQAGWPDPADPKAAAPALRYRSAFADYKPWRDTPPGDWRAVNDTVRDAAAQQGGGHAGHAMPAHPPASAPAPAPAVPAHGGPHGGHHPHGGKR